jgi:hypothetical protein
LVVILGQLSALVVAPAEFDDGSIVTEGTL